MDPKTEVATSWVAECLRGEPLGSARIFLAEAGVIATADAFKTWCKRRVAHGVSLPVTRVEHCSSWLTSRKAAREFVKRLRASIKARKLHPGRFFTPDGGPAVLPDMPVTKKLREQWEAAAPLGGVADA